MEVHDAHRLLAPRAPRFHRVEPPDHRTRRPGTRQEVQVEKGAALHGSLPEARRSESGGLECL